MNRYISNGKMSLSLSATVNNAMENAARIASGAIGFSRVWTISNGVDDNQGTRAWEYSGTLAAGENRTINLTSMVGIDAGAGSGKDIVGQLMDLLEIVGIVVANDNAVDAVGTLEAYPDATNGWQPIGRHTVENGGAVRGQGCVFKSNPSDGGFDVSGSGVNLTLAAQYGAVDFTVMLIARHDTNESSSSSSVSSSTSGSSSSSVSSLSNSRSTSSASSASSLNSSSSSASSSSSS